MSKKSTPKFGFVIDASIAKSAGLSADIRSESCRLLLETITVAGHRIVLNELIVAEWDRHKSGFANLWLISMISKRKVSNVESSELAAFREAISEHFGSDRIPESLAVLKDAHLVEAAFRSNKRVVSLDDTARQHLLSMSRSFHALHEIMWANPAKPAEKVVPWIAAGAKFAKSRLL